MNIGNLTFSIENIAVNDNKQNIEVKGNNSFKYVVDKSKADTKKVSNEDLSEKVESQESINEQIEEVVKKIDDENEDEIIEEVMVLLQSLNIEVIDNTTLPIIIDMPNSEIDIASITDDLSGLQNDFNANLELSDSQLEITEDNIDKVLMLLADKEGNKVSKDKFLEVINISKNEIEEASTGIEMVTMVFKSENTQDNDSENDILMKMLLEDIDEPSNYLAVEDSITDELVVNEESLQRDNLVFADVINNQSNKVNDLASEIKATTVTKESAATDVVTNLNYMVKNNIQQLTVKVYPKELGEITIKLLSEDGIMKADIKATSKETYNLLNSNMEEIKKYLSNENISIKEVNIELYNDDTTYFSGEGFDGELPKETQKEEYSLSEDKMIHLNDELAEEVFSESSNVNLLA